MKFPVNLYMKGKQFVSDWSVSQAESFAFSIGQSESLGFLRSTAGISSIVDLWCHFVNIMTQMTNKGKKVI